MSIEGLRLLGQIKGDLIQSRDKKLAMEAERIK